MPFDEKSATNRLLAQRVKRPDTLTRRIRQKLKISQQGLATKIGVSESTIDRWEGGVTPLPFLQKELEKIARANKVKLN